MAPVEPKPEKDKEKSFLVNESKQFDAFSTYLPFLGVGDKEDLDKLTSRAINAAIVLGFGTFAITKLFTTDHEYWHVSHLNYLICAIRLFIINLEF